MDIQAFRTGFIQACKATYNATKVAATWLGRNIQSGFTNYIVPFVKAVWARSLPYLISFKDMMVAGKCPPLLLAALLFGAGVAAFKISDCKAFEDNRVATTICTVVGIISFVGMTIFATLGIATGLA